MFSAMAAPDQTTSALFVAFDRNKDGRLSYEDLRQGFNKSGYRISGEELKALVDRFDTDGDGALDFPEMLTVMACLHKSNKARDDLYKIFNAMDANGNRQISKKELQTSLALYCDQKVSDEEMDEIMSQVDFDNDGYMCFKEFSKCIHLFKK
ncbi:calmodulin-4-like [Bolinopsis microptera]|uniref:calmodulin-4-like n=2 Tax=Bolinopsis microptera TaxID=2820187 RepID=UPI00307A9522